MRKFLLPLMMLGATSALADDRHPSMLFNGKGEPVIIKIADSDPRYLQTWHALMLADYRPMTERPVMASDVKTDVNCSVSIGCNGDVWVTCLPNTTGLGYFFTLPVDVTTGRGYGILADVLYSGREGVRTRMKK